MWGERAHFWWEGGQWLVRGAGMGSDGYNNGYYSGWVLLDGGAQAGVAAIPAGPFFEDDPARSSVWGNLSHGCSTRPLQGTG